MAIKRDPSAGTILTQKKYLGITILRLHTAKVRDLKNISLCSPAPYWEVLEAI